MARRVGLGTLYGETMYEQEGLLTTWLPDRSLSVGDVVQRDPASGAVSVETTIDQLLSRPVAAIKRRKGPESLVLQRGVTVEGVASTGLAVATAEVRFTKARSFLFSAQHGSSAAFDRLEGMRSALLELHKQGQWSNGWQLVTGVRTFEQSVVLIARDDEVAARVSADLTTGLAGVEALVAAGGISVTRGDAAKWEMRSASPLFESLSVSLGFWTGEAKVGQRYLDNASEDLPTRVVRTVPGDQEL